MTSYEVIESLEKIICEYGKLTHEILYELAQYKNISEEELRLKRIEQNIK